ncbi:MarR family winged helix-turn-helix transcriptional regulator [Dyella sp. Tek66A03]|uniref:MarR family winged helix-turn-helix transcriptional regulator n=1 Tax=Dyella sp. Tek66A03 TaxID=3458298 RepID=UPI00403E77D6
MNTKAMQTPDSLASIVNEVTRDCLITPSRRISRVVTKLFDQELRPFGLSSSQFSLLVLIARLDGASRADIGRANHQERSTSTRNLQLVLDQGWAEEIIPVKGRTRPVVISQAGRDLLAKAMSAWRAAQAQARHLLGVDGASAIVQVSTGLPVEELAG